MKCRLWCTTTLATLILVVLITSIFDFISFFNDFDLIEIDRTNYEAAQTNLVASGFSEKQCQALDTYWKASLGCVSEGVSRIMKPGLLLLVKLVSRIVAVLILLNILLFSINHFRYKSLLKNIDSQNSQPRKK